MSEPIWMEAARRHPASLAALECTVKACDQLGVDMERDGRALYLMLRSVQCSGPTRDAQMSRLAFLLDAFQALNLSTQVVQCSHEP